MTHPQNKIVQRANSEDFQLNILGMKEGTQKLFKELLELAANDLMPVFSAGSHLHVDETAAPDSSGSDRCDDINFVDFKTT